MKTKEKQKKKNLAGFTDLQLSLLLRYCYFIKKNPKMYFSEIHRNLSSYSRTSTTVNSIKNALLARVIWGPYLFTNGGVEASLFHNIDNPRKFYEECLKDKSTNLVVLSHGHWPIFLCKQGANTLQFHDSILPNNGHFLSNSIENIFFEEKGILPNDVYPHKWFEKHWDVYHCLKYPRDKTFREAGKELGIDWVSTRKYFLEVLEQSKVMMNFFPLGIESYSPLLVTLKTEYEIGFLKGLKALNRTTYIYKVNNILILYIFVSPIPKEHNFFTDKFQRLEEMGLIHDLHISTPSKWHRTP